MREEVKQIAEAIVSHPKAAIAITAVINANVWTDYAEPIVKIITSLLGIVVLILLVAKHALDIKKEHFTKRD